MSPLPVARLTAVVTLVLLLGGCDASGPARVGGSESLTTLRQGVYALVDRQVWQTRSAASGNSFFAIRGGTNPAELTIVGLGLFVDAGTTGATDRITLALTNVSGIGSFPLATANQGTFTRAAGTATTYATDTRNTGVVIITAYDPVRGLVSGTFAFDAAAGAIRIRIADGRFTDLPLVQ